MPSFNRQSGALSFPTTVTGETSLQSLDPASDILIALFRRVILSELTPRWNTARIGTPLADRSPVEDTTDSELTPEFLQQKKSCFPLLAVYRGEAEASEFTMTIDRITQKWGVDYVLGPLDVAGQRKLGNMLPAIGKALVETVRVGGHPDYAMASNGSQPEQVLIGSGADCCNFSSVRVVSFDSGQASFATEGQGPTYWALSLQLETTEDNGRADPDLGMTDHTADWGYDLSDGDTAIEDIVEAEQLFED